MEHTLQKETASEHRLLCGVAFLCYSAALASLILLAYSLAALVLSEAGQQIVAVYSRSGI